MTFLWILLGVLYIFPVLWIVGAIMQPTRGVAAAESRARLQ